jgi:hypothetical protein
LNYTVTGLSPAPFHHLYGLPESELARHRARRVIAGESGFPERIELRDADPGETLLLVNYEHQDADTPFRASHAIYIREGAIEAVRVAGLPDVLRRRLLSLRAFSADGMLVDADVAEGEAADPLIRRMLGDGRVAYIHAHAARPGCYLARIDRGPADFFGDGI